MRWLALKRKCRSLLETAFTGQLTGALYHRTQAIKFKHVKKC
jgi:hypothetical protein